MMRVLPKKVLSYWVGKLVHVQWPKPMANWAIQTFGNYYQINFAEAEKPASEYRSIGDFFVRQLKPGVRPVADTPIVHPADSLISQIGEIQSGKCIQAKGKTYSVGELCGNLELGQKFEDGLFATYYLCPTDYHRVHSPVDGVIKRTIHIPGHLWPVNNWSTENIENLFAVNERVVLEIQSATGTCLLIFVGATNVGQIHLAFDPSIVTNSKLSWNSSKGNKVSEKIYSPPVPVAKGAEVGAFHMGSTVVMVYPKDIRMSRDDWSKFQNKKVKFGESFL